MNKIIKVFQLEDLLNQEVRHLSAGQTTRLNIAKALINYPKVLLLDEPTASLDPDVAVYIREFLANERKQFQVSIIITSHNMAEVEELCDRVVFINSGKVVADDTPENLARTIEISHIRLLVAQETKPDLIAICQKNNLTCLPEGRYMMIDIQEKAIPLFLQELSKANINYDEISIERPSLEDYFLQKARQK